MMKSNYHTHHYLCKHAKGNVDDYVLEALKNNFEEIGISDHGPINAEAFPRMSMEEFYDIYLKELNEAIEKYGDNIKIYKGLEIEYIYGDIEHYHKLLEELDYLILGPHYYKGEKVLHPYSTYAVNNHELLEEYTKYIEEALDTKCFKILAHPDLFINGYKDIDLYAESCIKRICEAVERNDCFIEFNAGGIRNNKNFDADGNPLYAVPNDKFWKIVETTNVKVIIGSDCHLPEELADSAFHKAHELIKKYNVNLKYKIFE